MAKPVAEEALAASPRAAEEQDYSAHRLGELRVVAADIYRLLRHVGRHRRRQLLFLAVLQVFGAFSDVVSIAAIVPFLAALTNAKELLARPELAWLVRELGITTEAGLIGTMAALFAAVFLAASGLRILTLWTQTRLAAAIGSDLVREVYRRGLFQPYQFHTVVNSSKMISGIVYDFNVAVSTVSNAMMLTTQGLVIFSIVSGLLAYSPKIALWMGAVTVVAFTVISRITKRRLVVNARTISDRSAQMQKTLQEGYGGIREVVLTGKQGMFVSLFSGLDRPIRRASANNQFLQTMPRYVLESVLVVTLCLAVGILALIEGGLSSTLPTLGALALAANRLLPAAQQVYLSLAGMRGAHVSLRRTLTALDRPLDPVALADRGASVTLNREIGLRHVWFRYGEARDDETGWVLKDISLTIPVNTTVALVGSTGCGKSTIADLIMGLLRPQRGEVVLDGQAMDDAAVAAWRRSIAQVPQSVYLSDATVKENIAFGEPADRIDMERLRAAARQAQIADFIEGRPLKYDEMAGERGIRLSGGQRQRLGIARALYRGARVIVFDEATSALDNTTEHAVMESIRALANRVTILLIAHRLTTVKFADAIYEIGAGRVVARGTYDELVKSSASFRALTMIDSE